MTESLQWVVSVLNADIGTIGIAVVACCVMAIFERLIPAGLDPGLGGRVHNIATLVYVLLGLLVLPLITNWLIPFLPKPALIERLSPDLRNSGLPGTIAAAIVYALVWDFFQYWTHRAQHVFPILWKFHRVHHSDRMLNASSAVRISYGSAILGYFFASLPTLAVCGGGLLHVVAQYLLFNGWGYVNHANCKISFGRLAWLASGPQWHRLHHGKAEEFHNCNYAAFFPVLDGLFGTLKLPRQGEWPETGIENDTTPRNPFKQVFFPWRNEYQ